MDESDVRPRSTSPVISDAVIVPEEFDFPEAIRRITNGELVSKKEWNDEEYYGIVSDGQLMLHKPDGKLYIWWIKDGDLAGEDWFVVTKKGGEK